MVQGLLHVEVSLLEFCALLPLSQICRPGIDCRVCLKVLGAFLESLAIGPPKPGLSLLILLLHSDILALREKRLATDRDLPC